MALVDHQFADMDVDSATLALQLQLDDIGGYQTSYKGKRGLHEGDDEFESMQLFQAELNKTLAIIKDHQICQSIANALHADYDILKTEMEAEATALRDRALAQQMQSNGTSRPTSAEVATYDEELLAKLAFRYCSEDAGYQMLNDIDGTSDEVTFEVPAESSTAGARREARSSKRSRRCCCCQELTNFENVARAPCGDEYCRRCLDELFMQSIKDETLFPPRCHSQRIPFELVRLFLTEETAAVFAAKSPELETPNRTYCHRAQCSTWIPPAYIDGDSATCPACAITTCIHCKLGMHGGECAADRATQLVLDTAEANGWQRCYRCRRVIELNTGCNHMTCPCGGQFCYVCGDPWKTCTCAQWDEDRLYARAEQIFDRGNRPREVQQEHHRDVYRADELRAAYEVPLEEDVPGATNNLALQVPEPPAQAPESFELATGRDLGLDRLSIPLALLDSTGGGRGRAQMIDTIVNNLRDNHACRHIRWRYVAGPGVCEECTFRLPKYTYECSGCHLRACWRCRKNRL